MFRDHKSYRTLTETEKGIKPKPRPYRAKPLVNCINKKKYKCDICPKTWMSEIDAEYHREFEHGIWLREASKDGKNNVCGICFRDQQDRDQLISHMKIEHYHSSPDAKRIEREIFFCDICQHMFFNKLILTWHIVHHHFKHVKVRLDCVLCMKTPCGTTLWWHTLKHNFSSITTCPFCFENFKEKQEMLEHVPKHRYLLRCDTCLYDTKIRESYTKHLQDHRKRTINDIPYKRYFMMGKEPKYVVEAWLKGIPVPLGVSICVLCREICLDEESKKFHILVEHGYVVQPKKTHMCACGEEFFNSLLLKHHVWKLNGIHRVLSEEEIKNMDTTCVVYDFFQDVGTEEINDANIECSMDDVVADIGEAEIKYTDTMPSIDNRVQDIGEDEIKSIDTNDALEDRVQDIVIVIPEQNGEREKFEEREELIEAYVIQEED